MNVYEQPVTLYKHIGSEMEAPNTVQSTALNGHVSSIAVDAKAGKSQYGTKATKATTKSSKSVDPDDPNDDPDDPNDSCDDPVKFVKIYHDKTEYLNIAEVQVFVDVNGVETNVALATAGGVATQSSTWSDSTITGSPEKAIDGNTSGAWVDNSIAHTENNPNPWWKLELASVQCIVKVDIWNRMDTGAPQRLTGAVVTLLDSSENVISWFRLTDATSVTTFNLAIGQFSVPPVGI
jgi:hypothetical protein